MHDGAGRRLRFRGGFAHRDPGDALDLLSQQVDGTLEQLPVKLLHLRQNIEVSHDPPLSEDIVERIKRVAG